ncbi:MAG: prenyltransferase [Actinomycetota bacterium]
MSAMPELAGVLSPVELERTARHLVSLQVPTGMIPWFPGGHCDPWNHVETAMALDVAGFHTEARHAYRWLRDTQRADGSWHAYYHADGTVEDAKLDTNVCAYIATGVHHHLLITGDTEFATAMWPTVERAIEFVLALRRSDGVPLWAIETDERPWTYALLTGTSSIQHALRSGAALAESLGTARTEWLTYADEMAGVINNCPDAFEPKTRWAMDWYYPVLTGAMTGDAAATRLADGWSTFAMEGLGIRCVSDEPWVTASETAECALAYAAIGDKATATKLLEWTTTHRCQDGSYLTGIVYPAGEVFPPAEYTSYTAAAVVLAVDSITQATDASDVFRHAGLA